MAGRSGIEALLYLMDEAFHGPGIEDTHESQALLTNLATVEADAWRALPEHAARSIESIALHVGALALRPGRTRLIGRQTGIASPPKA